MLRLDARRAALLVVVPGLAGVGVLAAWRMLLPGVAYWDNAVVALTASVRLLGPVAAALAAWVAVREHRLDYLRGLTPRSPATGPLLDLLLLTGAALLAYGVVATIIVGEAALQQRPGAAQPLGLLAGAAALALHVVLGYLAGRLAPSPVIIVVAGTLTGLWAALRGSGSSWWSLLPPAAIGQVELFTALRGGVLADQVCWSLGLMVTLIAGYVWTVTRRGLLVVPLAGALAITMLSTVRLASSDGAAVVPAPVGHVCRQWPLKICVHPALHSALPSLEAALTPLAGRLSATPAAFTRVVQRPESDPAGIRRGVASVHLTDLTPGYESRLVREMQAGLVDTRSCTDPAHARGRVYRTLIDAWLVAQEPGPIPPAAPATPATGNLEAAAIAASVRLPANAGVAWVAHRFTGWDEAHRRAWLGAHYSDYRSCTLTQQDFS